MTAATATPSPTPSATSLDPATQDLRNAEQAVVAMVAKVDQLAQDPTSDLTSLTEVARDQALLEQRSILISYGEKGWRLVGSSKVISPVASQYSFSVWKVAACIDVSGTDVVDKSQRSVVSQSRPPRIASTFDVSKDNGKFYVVKRVVTETC